MGQSGHPACTAQTGGPIVSRRSRPVPWPRGAVHVKDPFDGSGKPEQPGEEPAPPPGATGAPVPPPTPSGTADEPTIAMDAVPGRPGEPAAEPTGADVDEPGAPT